MMFSSSMSVVEYYLLNRFPVPYGTSCFFTYLFTLLKVHILTWLISHSSAVFFVVVAFFAAIIGQHIVRKLVNWLGRASLIIFILAFMIFVSALSLGTVFYTWLQLTNPTLWAMLPIQSSSWPAGGVGISNMVNKIAHHEYMGFENLCKYEA